MLSHWELVVLLVFEGCKNAQTAFTFTKKANG
jgi:hypothetical protein